MRRDGECLYTVQYMVQITKDLITRIEAEGFVLAFTSIASLILVSYLVDKEMYNLSNAPLNC